MRGRPHLSQGGRHSLREGGHGARGNRVSRDPDLRVPVANANAAEVLAAVAEHITLEGQAFIQERTGIGFEALIVAMPSIDPRLDLGNDPRERALLSGLRNSLGASIPADVTPIPPDVRYGDVLAQTTGTSFVEDTVFPRWQVTKRDDNPANPVIQFWLIKIADADVEES